MSPSMIRFILAAAMLLGAAHRAHAESSRGTERVTRLGMGGFYDSFSEGGDNYGPWWGVRMQVQNGPPPGVLGLTGIFELVAERHEDHGAPTGGAYLVGGAYYDWNDWIYTYSSLGFGTNQPFANLTLHQEVNFKLLTEKKLVLGVGGGLVDYHDVNSNTYLSLGSAYYWTGSFRNDPEIVIQYQYRLYFSDPTFEVLDTHILTTSIGWQPGRWTRVRFIHGQEAFRAGGGSTPVFDANYVGEVLTLEHEEQVTEKLSVLVGMNLASKSNLVNDLTLFRGLGFDLGVRWTL